METIGQSELWTYLDGKADSVKVNRHEDVTKNEGHLVKSYIDLAAKVAELQYRNREQVLLFRGQSEDHKNRSKNSSLKPKLFRGNGSSNPSQDELVRRFNKLQRAEVDLVKVFSNLDKGELGKGRIARHRIMRWSVLQHYEVCPTPLLDVTHSLRIAASFATHRAEEDMAYLYVLGVPFISGAVTASAEAGLQVVRLSSICPPQALRPHIQEGYLLGEYPDLHDFSQKSHYPAYEIDFGRRLVAKFRFKPSMFWRVKDFPPIGKKALLPSVSQDPMSKKLEPMRKRYMEKA